MMLVKELVILYLCYECVSDLVVDDLYVCVDMEEVVICVIVMGCCIFLVIGFKDLGSFLQVFGVVDK